MSTPLPPVCPNCKQPAQPEDRFCSVCAYPLRQSCRVCRQETLIWARFCPNCGATFAMPGTQQEERDERQVIVGLGLPEGPQMPTAPGVSAAPQTGAPTVSSAPAGPQTGAPTVSSAPAGPQTGAPTMPTAPAPPQSGAPPVQSAPPVQGVPPPSQPGMPGVFGGHPGYQTGMVGRAVGKGAARNLGSRLVSTTAGKVIAAVVAAIIVVTSGTAIAAATGHNPLSLLQHNTTSTTGSNAAPPPVPEVTYIGSDGNVWDVVLPKGTPKQLTTDAVVGNANTGTAGIYYSGLAWSPDGKELAVVRVISTGSNTELFLLKPDGTMLWKHPISGFLTGSLVWSPDGRFIAYRLSTSQCDPTTLDCSNDLFVVDARTGATSKMLSYNDGPVGECGAGAGLSIFGVIYAAHHTYFGLDTFAWSPDGKELLVAFGCGGGSSNAVALSNGSVTSGYPAAVNYQPGGRLMLGIAVLSTGNESLELTDQTGKQVRVLASSTGQLGTSPYLEDVGVGTWSSDGKTIYYEYQDGIWRVKVDGSGAKQLIAGTQVSSSQPTVELAPSLSPDGKWLLYLQASVNGAIDLQAGVIGPATGQWYVAQPDGSGAQALPQATVNNQDYNLQPPSVEAIWRP